MALSTQRRAAAHVNAELPLGSGVPALPGSEMERYRPSFLNSGGRTHALSGVAIPVTSERQCWRSVSRTRRVQ